MIWPCMTYWNWLSRLCNCSHLDGSKGDLNMAIPRNAYNMLESVVGIDNISEDPTMLDVYSFHFLAELQRNGTGTKFLTQKPGAIILPGSVQEVQKILTECNRFGL